MLKFIPLAILLFTSTNVCAQTITYADAVDKAAPSVVSIQTSKLINLANHPIAQDPYYKFFFGENELQKNIPSNRLLEQGLGSGVIIDHRGYILTNHHVISNVSEIIIKLGDGRAAKAQIIGLDAETDLAVLKINLANLPIIKLGNAESMRVGDIVLAIGNQFGFNNTVTQGIISAKSNNRNVGNDNIFGAMIDNLLQTDAAINPGSSGGALIDLTGRLIGINTAIFTKTGASHGIGFAIPINIAMNIMEQLIANGKILRGWLGVRLHEISPEMRQYLNYHNLHGIYVQATIKNSPAQNAGILPGDILVSINNHELTNVTTTLRLIASLKANETCNVKVFRKNTFHEYSLIVENKKV
jgi:S1-C subfamily serine protease